ARRRHRDAGDLVLPANVAGDAAHGDAEASQRDGHRAIGRRSLHARDLYRRRAESVAVLAMRTSLQSEDGFTLPELLVATGILLVVSSIVTNALLQMTNQQQTIWNRTEMHSGVRGATELLQQEVGQAGR